LKNHLDDTTKTSLQQQVNENNDKGPTSLLKERALKHAAIDQVILVIEELTCPDFTKHQCYEMPGAEKQMRATLKSAFD
jgi:hypothetical protein